MNLVKYFKPGIRGALAITVAITLNMSHAVEMTPTQPLNSNAYTDSAFDRNLTVDSSDDTIIAAWQPGNSTELLHISRSVDGGITWSAPEAFTDGSQDMKIVYVGNDNWTIFNDSSASAIKSTDDGLTWSDSFSISVPDGYPHWIVENTVSNDNGLLLTYEIFDQEVPTVLFHSLDGGASWDEIGSGPVGELLGGIRHSGGSNWIAAGFFDKQFFRSTDDGQTWFAAGNPFNFENLRGPYVESDHNGNLVAIMVENVVAGEDAFYRNYVSVSNDHGATWSPALRVHQNTIPMPQDAAQGAGQPLQLHYLRHVTDDRWILFSFDILNVSFWYRGSEMSAATSYDGGLTWTRSEEISADTGNWIGTGNTASGINNTVEAAHGNVVMAWEGTGMTIDGQSLGNDSDIVYRMVPYTEAPASAEDWQLFQ